MQNIAYYWSKEVHHVKLIKKGGLRNSKLRESYGCPQIKLLEPISSKLMIKSVICRENWKNKVQLPSEISLVYRWTYKKGVFAGAYGRWGD